MSSILAIAFLAMRTAVRSRIVIVLLLFLLFTLIGLPLTIKGDGTIAGHVRLLLLYTLGLASLILSIATVWASCAAISSEIDNRQIQMIVSKPVRPLQLWLGKWLGLITMNSILLTFCAVITYGSLRWTTQPQRLSIEENATLQSEILLAQRRLNPRPQDLSQEAFALYSAARERGEVPEDHSPAFILAMIERTLQVQENMVYPGDFKRWVYDVPRLPREGRPLVLRYRFSSSTLDLEPINAMWTIGPPDAPSRYQVSVSDTPMAWHSIRISPEWVSDDGTLSVEYANLHPRQIAALFSPESDLQLMVYQGGFLLNYLKALLLIIIHLSFLSAIGLTAGAFFSIPVAVLTSFYFLLLVNAGRFLRRMVERGAGFHLIADDASRLEQVIHAVTHPVYLALNFIIQPVTAPNPLAPISAGEWIGWMEVLYMAVVKIVVYSGFLLGISIWHLKHKEVALPS